MYQAMKNRQSERGSAGSKFLLILTILFLIGHAGWNFIPVAYEAENFKQEMHSAVIQGLSLPPVGVTPADHVKNRILKGARENNIPDDAVILIKVNKGVVQAQVTFVKKVPMLPFGLYDYDYNFDYTAVPTGFLMKS